MDPNKYTLAFLVRAGIGILLLLTLSFFTEKPLSELTLITVVVASAFTTTISAIADLYELLKGKGIKAVGNTSV